MSLSPWTLLDIWERGLAQPVAWRALLLLAAAAPDTPLDELAALSVGQRDSHLLSLREHLFGRQLSAVAGCPACGERLELSFTTDDLRVPDQDNTGGAQELVMDGYRLQVRPPNSHDLLALAATSDPDMAESLLLSRCVSAEQGGAARAPERLPEKVRQAAVASLAAADPQAEILIAVSCPACQHTWKAPFDIASYLWRELESWAVRVLREVHDLARAYGWREADILALTPLRRQLYLEMVYG